MEEKAHRAARGRFSLIRIPRAEDERGNLCFVENHHLPFDMKRVFWIYGVGPGKTRGGHAHATCAEVIFPVSGSFEIWVDDGSQTATFRMDSPDKGIYIGPNVWCELRNFSADAVCVVFASQEYQPDGYVNDYDIFKQSQH